MYATENGEGSESEFKPRSAEQLGPLDLEVVDEPEEGEEKEEEESGEEQEEGIEEKHTNQDQDEPDDVKYKLETNNEEFQRRYQQQQ